MTKVQEIRENMCTQKLVRLRYVLVLRIMLLQREFCFKKIASFRMVSIFFLFLSPSLWQTLDKIFENAFFH